MSQAEELLNELTESEVYSADPATEEHIVIGADRVVLVPEMLQNIAVQYDHNIETVTFDCPRYWDEHDMSKMNVYVNYMLPNGIPGMAACTDITVDEADDSLMHFNWTISGNVTQVKGEITFLVCIKKCDAEGNEQNHWNSQLNREMYISEGLECQESTIYQHPDIVEHLLLRMDNVEAMSTPEYLENLVNEYLDKNPELILDKISEIATDEEIHEYVDSYLDEHLHTATTTESELTNSKASILRFHDISGVSEQETTTGAQLIDFGTGELVAGGTTKTWENDILTLTGDGSVAYQNVGYDILDLLTANPGKTLSFGFESISIGAEIGGSLVQININNADNTNEYASLLNGYGDVRGSYTIPEDVSDISAAKLRIYVKNHSTAASGTTKIIKPILYFGDVDSQPEYESYSGGESSPSPEYQQEIKSSVVKQIKTVGKNLLKNTGTDFTTYGIEFTVDEKGLVTASGTSTARAQLTIYRGVLEAGSYILSQGFIGSSTGTIMYLNYKVDGVNRYVDLAGITEATFTFTEDTDIIIICEVRVAGVTLTNHTFYPMLRHADIADNTWEPYKESVIELSEPITLNGFTEYKDRIVRRDGVLGIERNIGSKVYDSNDFQEVTWTEYECATFFVLPKPEDAYTYGEYLSTEAMCDKFTCNIVHPLDQLANVGNVVTAASAPNLWFGFEKGTTLETAQAVGDIYYMYVLKEPTFEPLPAADQIALNSLNTFDTITYISTDSEVKPIIKSEYATDDYGALTLSTLADNEKNVVKVETFDEKVDGYTDYVEEVKGFLASDSFRFMTKSVTDISLGSGECRIRLNIPGMKTNNLYRPNIKIGVDLTDYSASPRIDTYTEYAVGYIENNGIVGAKMYMSNLTDGISDFSPSDITNISVSPALIDDETFEIIIKTVDSDHFIANLRIDFADSMYYSNNGNIPINVTTIYWGYDGSMDRVYYSNSTNILDGNEVKY